MKKPSIAPAAVIGKAELCTLLGWTRPRLDRRLDTDATFPVKQRGTRAGGWEFDVAAVRTYLDGPDGGGAPAMRSRAARSRAGRPGGGIASSPAGAPSAAHHGESTASQRLKNAQAARAEDQLRKDRRELIDAEEMRMVLGTMMARLGKGLDALPDMLRRRLDLPEDAATVIGSTVDELRRGMVADLRAVLQKAGTSPNA